MIVRPILLSLIGAALVAVAPPSPDSGVYRSRVDQVRSIPGFVALWDFVKREHGATGRFDAWQADSGHHDFRLDAINYVREYWAQGRAATYDDFPLLGRGPFGQAIQIRQETDPHFRPCLAIPRSRLNDSGLDVKGPGRSVSLVVWLVRESGDHAIAGIWHEGLDQEAAGPRVCNAGRGMRQYALFAGLAGNSGAAAGHVSENGGASFGDRYARNLAVTSEVMPAIPSSSPREVLDRSWHVAGFSFDDAHHTVTAYLDGKATEVWIDHPEKHPFYQWAYRGWVQAQLYRVDVTRPGKDPNFPRDQFYEPPEGEPLVRTVLEEKEGQRVELQTFRFSKVRVTLARDARSRFASVVGRDLVALKANPFWFGHDLYAPSCPGGGGPFTIGRVTHAERSVGFAGYIGGVAVFARPLSSEQMRILADIGRNQPIPAPPPARNPI